MTDEEKEMQEEYLDFAMEPLIDEVADFLDKQKKKQNIIMNPKGVARLNAVYSALCDIMQKIDPEYKIEIKENLLAKGDFAIYLYCDEFIIDKDNKKVIGLILDQCPSVDIYYTTHKGGKTVLIFEIPKVYMRF